MLTKQDDGSGEIRIRQLRHRQQQGGRERHESILLLVPAESVQGLRSLRFRQRLRRAGERPSNPRQAGAPERAAFEAGPPRVVRPSAEIEEPWKRESVAGLPRGIVAGRGLAIPRADILADVAPEYVLPDMRPPGFVDR